MEVSGRIVYDLLRLLGREESLRRYDVYMLTSASAFAAQIELNAPNPTTS